MKKCDYCAEEMQDDAKKCKHCGEWFNKNSDQDNIKQVENENEKKLEGFGGWLTLFGLGIFATPIFIFFAMIYDFQSYEGLGILFNIVIILMYIWLNFLMVKRKKTFKKWFLVVGTTQVLLLALIALGANSEKNLYTQEELSSINLSAFRTLFYVTVWSLYLWNSKRVKNTFIN